MANNRYYNFLYLILLIHYLMKTELFYYLYHEINCIFLYFKYLY